MKKSIIIITLTMIIIMGWRIFIEKNPDDNPAPGENIFQNLTTKPKKGYPAPDFGLMDINGIERKLSDYKGRPVLINFWSIECPPCLDEMPVLQNAHEKMKDSIVILGINMGDPNDRIHSFVQSNKITFTILTDTDGKVSETYRIMAYPVTYFVNSDGIIVDYHTGQLSTEMLKKYLGILGLTSW